MTVQETVNALLEASERAAARDMVDRAATAYLDCCVYAGGAIKSPAMFMLIASRYAAHIGQHQGQSTMDMIMELASVIEYTFTYDADLPTVFIVHAWCRHKIKPDMTLEEYVTAVKAHANELWPTIVMEFDLPTDPAVSEEIRNNYSTLVRELDTALSTGIET